MSTPTDPPQRDRWARLRFSIIGPLLAAPPAPGDLRDAFATLAARTWRHPVSGLDVRFGLSTIERWYYAARRAADPIAVLRNRPRPRGRFASLAPGVIDTLVQQYREHPGWSAQLHFDNHCAICTAAKACTGFCLSELQLFADLLGGDVDVQRVEHVLTGARRCAYQITPKGKRVRT